MKFSEAVLSPSQLKSLSARRVWIEIVQGFCESDKKPSLSARRVWIEIAARRAPSGSWCRSLSARRVTNELQILQQDVLRNPQLMGILLKHLGILRDIH